MDMLTQEDLNKIGDVVDQRIDAKVGPMIDHRVGALIDEWVGPMIDKRVGVLIDERVGALIEERVGPMIDGRLKTHTEMILSVVKKGFDGVDARFDSMELKFDAKLAAQKHDLMDHTDSTVARAVGGLRAELRELNVII